MEDILTNMTFDKLLPGDTVAVAHLKRFIARKVYIYIYFCIHFTVVLVVCISLVLKRVDVCD